ncbi:MAG: ABC transporter ATP-binding protein, partial [Eubacterium sp.]
MDINESERQYEGYFKAGKNNAFKTLCAIYKGSSLKILLSSICFAIKHSPVWLLPIITANLINFAASSTQQDKTKIIMNAVAFGVLLII